jgi:arginase
MMKVDIILVPYDSGYRGVRTGLGPIRLLEHGVDESLRRLGHQVDVQTIESAAGLTTEIGTTFELIRELAGAVHSSVSDGALPIVLAGNCNSCVGTVAGSGGGDLGILWFDAHGDLNTPEITESGFLDGMGLAMATGRCWKAILATIPGFIPISDAHIVHVGSRALDPAEERMLGQSDIQLIPAQGSDAAGIQESVAAALRELRNRVSRIYVHVDVDVLDTGEARPNHLAVPGGLSSSAVKESITMAKELFELSAFAIASFDPAYDYRDAVLQESIALVEAAVA